MDKKEKIYKEESFKKVKILPGDSSESPDDFSKVVVFIDNAYFLRLKKYFFKSGIRFNYKKNQRFYKENNSFNFNMFPVIHFGSLDEFYSGWGWFK